MVALKQSFHLCPQKSSQKIKTTHTDKHWQFKPLKFQLLIRELDFSEFCLPHPEHLTLSLRCFCWFSKKLQSRKVRVLLGKVFGWRICCSQMLAKRCKCDQSINYTYLFIYGTYFFQNCLERQKWRAHLIYINTS